MFSNIRKRISNNDLVYNGTKSVYLLFPPKNYKSPETDLLLSGKQLQYVPSHKYLCVIIEDGNCEADVKRQLMKFYANANKLLKKFGKSSNNVHVKLDLELIVQTCTGVFWHDATKKSMHKLRVSYNNSFGKLFSLPYDCSE